MAWASRIIREASAEDAQRNEGDEMAIEFRRTTAELRAVDEDGFTFEGMAAVYDSPSAEGTNPEIVKKGAFARSLAAAGRGEWDVKAYADHNPERLLGTTKTGTLELEDREDGLLARIRLNPNVSFHRDLAEIVRTMGKSLGLSFGFYSTNANKVNEEGVRELRDVKLVEVSALTGLSPYYPSTISTVSVRSLASEAGLEIEPLRAAVNALLSGDVSEEQARLLAEAIAAVVAEDEAEKAEDIAEGEVVEEMPAEETIVEESAPRSVPRYEEPGAVRREGLRRREGFRPRCCRTDGRRGRRPSGARPRHSLPAAPDAARSWLCAGRPGQQAVSADATLP
jgi:HK97 family phage prohead protease